jgi:glycosyltransferase involved in cell wall biosynthesis
MKLTRVRTFYQTDPAGTIPGGIDTFIRGMIKAAPADVVVSVVGLTTDAAARPVGRWTECSVDGHSVWFFPVGRLKDPRTRSRVPLSLLLAAGIARHFYACSSGCDVLDFHRVEPALLFLRDPRPKNAFVHQNMADALASPRSDLRWKALPGLFFRLERLMLQSAASVFGVRADAIEAYRARYPALAGRFRFIPTWMDPEVFFPADEAPRNAQRTVVSVGRLDAQKNPVLLIDGFALLARRHADVRLVLVGDGVLRKALEARIAGHGLGSRVVLAGLRAPREVADLLRRSDCFVLSSAYEGMPMCVLEALGCGIPVVSTRVGEVERVVKPGVTGELVAHADPEALAQALEHCLERPERYTRRACTGAVAEYVPKKVLQPVFEHYRRLAQPAPARPLVAGGLQ